MIRVFLIYFYKCNLTFTFVFTFLIVKFVLHHLSIKKSFKMNIHDLSQIGIHTSLDSLIHHLFMKAYRLTLIFRLILNMRRFHRILFHNTFQGKMCGINEILNRLWLVLTSGTLLRYSVYLVSLILEGLIYHDFSIRFSQYLLRLNHLTEFDLPIH